MNLPPSCCIMMKPSIARVVPAIAAGFVKEVRISIFQEKCVICGMFKESNKKFLLNRSKHYQNPSVPVLHFKLFVLAAEEDIARI